MPDLLRQGAVWLEQMRTTHCTSVVTYRAPDSTPDTYSVNATYGKTEFEVVDESGLTVGAHMWDFLILAAELPGVEPSPGHVITADGRNFEVLPLGADFRGWRWSDAYRQSYRIHTKDIGPST
ncbi:MAG: hypothetical protein ACYC26_15495 [Phycisphaerales bacterium]